MLTVAILSFIGIGTYKTIVYLISTIGEETAFNIFAGVVIILCLARLANIIGSDVRKAFSKNKSG